MSLEWLTAYNKIVAIIVLVLFKNHVFILMIYFGFFWGGLIRKREVRKAEKVPRSQRYPDFNAN